MKHLELINVIKECSPITNMEQLEKIYSVWLTQKRSHFIFDEEIQICLNSMRIEKAEHHSFLLRGNGRESDEAFHPVKVDEIKQRILEHNERKDCRMSLDRKTRQSDDKGYPTDFRFIFGKSHINENSLDKLPSFDRDVIYLEPRAKIKEVGDNIISVKIRDFLHSGNTLRIWAEALMKSVYPEVLAATEPYTWVSINFHSYGRVVNWKEEHFNTPENNLVYTLSTHQVDPECGSLVAKLDGVLNLVHTGHNCLNVRKEQQGGCALSACDAYNVEVNSVFYTHPDENRYGFLIPSNPNEYEKAMVVVHEHAQNLALHQGSLILDRCLADENYEQSMLDSLWEDEWEEN